MGCRNACICSGRCSESCYEAERAERIIRSKIDRSYINKTAVITLDKESEK